ncbi:hypothetical protein [Serratia sp. AKBS12]|uniref:hypothetical protein n=1 Tax=Serratia sp. AKBS12 TaxID=2974597 RepID=UPI002165E490|nr:hypothetical protein [Serratia sp. AKBS12]MCS3408035.1 hypothetical protein [Serratia sp. AKBS12]
MSRIYRQENPPWAEWIRYRLDGDALLKFAESAAIRDIPATAAQNNAPKRDTEKLSAFTLADYRRK